MKAREHRERVNVAANTLNKLLGRRAPLPDAVVGACAKLAQLGEQQRDLRELAATNAALLEAMYRNEIPLPRITIDGTHARTKLRGGVPLLRGEPIVFDGAAVRGQFLRLCGVLANRGNEFAAKLERATGAGGFPVADLATEVIAGDPHAVAARAGERDLDAGLAAMLLRLTLFPAMVRLAAELRPMAGTEPWGHGFCPVCGSWPLLGEYRGLELARFLRCGVCATEWEVDRVLCCFCNNRTPQDLTNLTAEGEEQKQRAVACERCRCYVKQLSTLAPIPSAQLLVADLATLHLDLAALQRNYAPPQ